MAGPEPITPLNEGTSNQNITKSIIEGHVSALKELLKEPSNRDLIKPMLLDFNDIQDVSDEDIKVNKKGNTKVGDEDLSKPFKEVLKCPFTRRIIEFSSPGHRMPANAKVYDGTGDPEDHVGRFVGMGNQGEWPMPVWCKMFQQTLGGKARVWFDKLPPGNIDNWGDLQKKFLNRFGMLKACAKDPTEISKIIRRANETLLNFKERWVSESNAIPNVPELMQISSFMSSHKCPELSKRFSDNIPKPVDEMLKRVDDYLRYEEAFHNIELPKGESQQKETPGTRTSCTIHTTTTPQSGISSAKRKQGSLNLGLIDKYPVRDLSYRTPTTPATANVVEAVRNSFGVRQATPFGKGREAKRKRRSAEQRSVDGQGVKDVLTRDLSKEALVVEAGVEGYLVRRVHIDEGASVEIMFEHCFNMLHPAIWARLVETQTTVSRFSGEQVKPLGKIELDMCFEGSGLCRRAIMKFTIIPVSSPYNFILGRLGLKHLIAILPTIHGMMKFLTPWEIATLVSQEPTVFECRRVGKKQALEPPAEIEPQEKVGLTEQVLVNPAYPEQLVVIRKGLSPKGSIQLKNLLKKNKDIFAWEPSDMTKVSKRIIKHSLNGNPSVTPISQKRRVFCFEKSQVITKGVFEWLKAGIVRPMKYPTWISNPVLVKKVDGSWRMCIDFKNINAAWLPPSVDGRRRRRKTAFYTDQGTYCYTKRPFGLKNAGATYQRLVDETFQSQIGRNPEAYVEDMVVKRKSEREMLADIAETFDNLRRINMKLNPKKCSFGVEEGNFLGYMVTLEGI
ncbi:reverse transcriptase domain-containing protein [Tanacetum coccineum]